MGDADEESKKATHFFMTTTAPLIREMANKHGIEIAREMMKTAAIKAGLNPDDFDVFLSEPS